MREDLLDSPHAERNRRTGEQRRQKTRLNLINAAIEVIAERGYEAPVIDDFIVAADVSRGSFYNHFKTKEGLIEAVAEHIRAESLRTSDLILKAIADPAERLAWGIRNIVRHAGSSPQLSMLLLGETLKATAFDALIRRGPKRDISECIAKRRLPYQDTEVAVDLVAGATREAARAAITVPRPTDHPEQVAHLIMRGLGMSDEDAKAVAYKAPPVFGQVLV